MEAIVIKIHGRQVCKLIDPDKVKKVKDELSPFWNKKLREIMNSNRPEAVEIL